MPQPRAILDVGCGTGRLLRAAEQRFTGARLEGVDAAEGMIAEARSAASGSSIGFQQGTAEHLPFGEAIREIARVLKPQGRWLLADFIATGPMRLVFAVTRPKRFHARARMDSLLTPAQLRVTAERRVPGLWGQVSALAIGHR